MQPIIVMLLLANFMSAPKPVINDTKSNNVKYEEISLHILDYKLISIRTEKGDNNVRPIEVQWEELSRSLEE